VVEVERGAIIDASAMSTWTRLFPASAAAALAVALAAPQAVLMNPKAPFWSEHAPAVYRVKFTTTRGDFVIEAHRDWAPLGADRFYNLVRAGFYDDSRFYRVLDRYIVQFGIAGDPAVAAVWRNEQFRDDPPPFKSGLRGTIAFAMTGPDTRTTQIYINTNDNTRNDKENFAIFATVVEGMDVVDSLYSGYGESAGGGMRGGKQAKMFEGGNAYLDKEFPKLDKLISAKILP
jgi:cyclophilin family peptidyl-prolyl cis-trans isomerase